MKRPQYGITKFMDSLSKSNTRQKLIVKGVKIRICYEEDILHIIHIPFLAQK